MSRAASGTPSTLPVFLLFRHELDIGVLRGWLAGQHATGHARATLARRAAAAHALATPHAAEKLADVVDTLTRSAA